MDDNGETRIPRCHVAELSRFFAAHDRWLFGHACVRTRGDPELAPATFSTSVNRQTLREVLAVWIYEKQMREYGYAAVAASSQAEAETGMRHNRLMFWLYRRMTGTSARVTS